MSEGSFIQVQTTTDSLVGAKEIVKFLLENKLAACVKIIEGASSNYLWNEKIEISEEIVLLINTTGENYLKVEEMIKKIHHYETPEVIATEIKLGSSEYLDWLKNSIN